MSLNKMHRDSRCTFVVVRLKFIAAREIAMPISNMKYAGERDERI